MIKMQRISERGGIPHYKIIPIYKDRWNKEEHIASIKAFAKEFVANTETAYKQADIDKWISNNLN